MPLIIACISLVIYIHQDARAGAVPGSPWQAQQAPLLPLIKAIMDAFIEWNNIYPYQQARPASANHGMRCNQARLRPRQHLCNKYNALGRPGRIYCMADSCMFDSANMRQVKIIGSSPVWRPGGELARNCSGSQAGRCQGEHRMLAL